MVAMLIILLGIWGTAAETFTRRCPSSFTDRAARLTDADRQVRSPRHDAPADLDTQAMQFAGADIGP
jgi:hypothetical protein